MSIYGSDRDEPMQRRETPLRQPIPGVPAKMSNQSERGILLKHLWQHLGSRGQANIGVLARIDGRLRL